MHRTGVCESPRRHPEGGQVLKAAGDYELLYEEVLVWRGKPSVLQLQCAEVAKNGRYYQLLNLVSSPLLHIAMARAAITFAVSKMGP